MGNRASRYCAENGGVERILYGTDGGQYGVCFFDDGTACDSWAYFRGECTEGSQLEFSSFCREHGGYMRRRRFTCDGCETNMFYWNCGIDGYWCDENSYYEGECDYQL